jgi:quinol monooxygenase YgiN
LYGKCPGFVGALLLVDTKATRARSITVWESTAAMDSAAEQPHYTETMQELAGHFAAMPDVESWTLAASLFPPRRDD